MLSILIPTSGRNTTLPGVLESALDQCGRSDHSSEIIVVDNNQDDGLAKLIRRQCKSASRKIRYVRELSPGSTAARHRAADEAKGDLLVFLDDDVVLGDQWLAGMLDGFSNSSVDIVGGPSVPRFQGSIPAWFWDFLSPTPYGGWMCTWLSLLDIGRSVDDIKPNFVWTLNFGIRKEVLRELGGFNPDLVPDHLRRWQGDGETGLTLKAQVRGARASYISEALVFHRVDAARLTAEHFSRRAYFQGICDSFTKVRAGEPLAQAHWVSDGEFDAGASGSWAKESAAIKRLAVDSYREGFEFHQREVANDRRLLEWAQREHFWGADIRTLARD